MTLRHHGSAQLPARTVTLVLLGAMAWALAGPPTLPAAPVDSADEAAALARGGRHGEAGAMLLRLLPQAADPKQRAALHIQLGDVYAEQVRFADAVTQYDAALALDPALAVVHFKKGAILVRIPERHREGIAALEKSHDLGYDHPDRLYLVGSAYKSMAESDRPSPVQRGEYLRRAVESFEKALEQDPRSLHVLGNLADIHFNARRYDQALAFYQRARAIAPSHPVLMARMAHTYLVMGRPAEAVDLLRAGLATLATQGEPAGVQAGLVRLSSEISTRLYLGEALLQLGRTPEARQELQKVVELSDRTVEGHRLGGTTLEQRRRAQNLLNRLGD